MDRIAQLRNLIIKAKQLYYFGNSPIITDAEYDALEYELASLSPNDPILSMVGAPVPPDHILEKAAHKMHMGSQNKVNSEEGFRAWASKFNSEFHISPKADGGSAAAYYEDGHLVRVISRGDGQVGEDITASALKFKGLPAYVEFDGEPFEGSVRFEAVLTKENWNKIGGKNPRNMGNGIMGRKDGYQAEYITCYAFDLETDYEFDTEKSKLLFLDMIGFNIIPFCVGTIDDVIKYHHELMDSRGYNNSGAYPFWIDGSVIKVNDLYVQESAGLSPDGKTHKAQIAWKPASEGASTTLKSVVLSYGHTGAIIPNGRLEPVEIGGTTVSNVLLNNWEEIERLDIAIGDEVEVIKANDIIPKIIRVISRPENRVVIAEPDKCGICGSLTKRNQTQSGIGAITICINENCPAKQTGKLKTFIKKVGILGIGDSARESLKVHFDIHTPADLYRIGSEISESELSEMPLNSVSKLGENASKIIEEINSKKSLPLNIFLGSLGIDGLGRREVEIAIDKAPDELSTLADWRSGKLRDFALQAKINAPTKAEKWASEIEKNSSLIDGLLKHVNVEEPVPVQESGKSGTVCITGTLPSGKKKADYKDKLSEIGFELIDKITKDLDYLVIADPTSSSNKTQKAKTYNEKGANIKIISEEDLINLCEAQ